MRDIIDVFNNPSSRKLAILSQNTSSSDRTFTDCGKQASIPRGGIGSGADAYPAERLAMATALNPAVSRYCIAWRNTAMGPLRGSVCVGCLSARYVLNTSLGRIICGKIDLRLVTRLPLVAA